MMYDIPSGMYNAKLHFDKERVQSDNVITQSSILLKKGCDLKIKKKFDLKKDIPVLKSAFLSRGCANLFDFL